jgi:hypothetical protein
MMSDMKHSFYFVYVLQSELAILGQLASKMAHYGHMSLHGSKYQQEICQYWFQ